MTVAQFLLSGVLLSLTTPFEQALAQDTFTQSVALEAKLQYQQYCGECHGMKLKGSGHGPELAGPNFVRKWGNRSSRELFELISETMPAGNPGALGEPINFSITSYILQMNAGNHTEKVLQPGATQTIGTLLMGDDWDPSLADAVDSKSQSWEGAGSIAEAARQASGFVNQQVENYAPVTREMLAHPPAADWLSWRGTLDGHGYSPLDQVNRKNVGELRLAWVLAMRDGSNQGTPLVHDGTRAPRRHAHTPRGPVSRRS